MTLILILARTLHIGSAMLLVAFPHFMLTVFAPVLNAGNAMDHSSFVRMLTRWTWFALLVAALSGAVWFWLVAAQMGDQAPWALSLSDWTTVLFQTQFGQLWLCRLAIGAALGATLYVVGRNKAPAPGRALLSKGVVLFLSALFLIALAWAGHAAAGIHHRAFHLGIDIVHLLVGAIWPMGLIPLGLFLWDSRHQHQLFPENPETKIVRTFSRNSFIAVLVLVITGLINGWLMIPTWTALLTTTYGQLLLLKVLAVIIMVGLGACNRLYIVPRMNEGPHVVRALGRTVLAESLLALVVLFIVGVMGMTSPPP